MLEKIVLNENADGVLLKFSEKDEMYDAINEIGSLLSKFYGGIMTNPPYNELKNFRIESICQVKLRHNWHLVTYALLGDHVSNVDKTKTRNGQMPPNLMLGTFQIHQMPADSYWNYRVVFNRRDENFINPLFYTDRNITRNDAVAFWDYITAKLAKPLIEALQQIEH